MDRNDDGALVARLRAGDETAFLQLVDSLAQAMQRVARSYVHDAVTAQEVCQDAWLAMLEGLDRFEGRSSLRSWIFAIVVNKAKTRGERERRSVPFSNLVREEVERNDPAVPADRFAAPGSRWPRHWQSEPASWGDEPGARLLAKEARAQLAAAIEALPPAQRVVVTMHDITGISQRETCNVLGLSETNVRVLLHRARAKLRRALASYLTEEVVA